MSYLAKLMSFGRRAAYGLRHSLGNPGFDVLLLGVIFQTGHTFEHFAQMFQHVILGWPAKESHGILAGADIEISHFLANVVLMLVIGFVYYAWEFHRPESAIRQFRGMRVLMRVLLVVQGYHLVEHTVRYYQHVQTGLQGTPGLVGALLGPKVIFFHFWINMVVYPGMVALLGYYIWNMQLYPALLQARSRARIREYVKLASADGRMTDDERMILARIRYETDLQSRELLERLQAGATSSDLKVRLRQMQAALVESATAQAMVDGRITQEERRLLRHLAETSPILDVLAKLDELAAKDHVRDSAADAAPA